MAKEYTGIMLVLLVTIKGQQMLKKRFHFRDPDTIMDWIMLLQTLLQWVEWLNSTTMPMKDVQCCPKKHQCCQPRGLMGPCASLDDVQPAGSECSVLIY